MPSFIYCFTNEDKQSLLQKGYKFFREEIIGNQNVYVFLYDEKLNFTPNQKRFILTNRINY